eukprot:GFKZ01008306.1.p1 GENE.GFKZ01008306.1~~GFKZ01008306.1.p1  ORF type:complete len:176 (+),score=14.43 GFKZ01008306.1:187-714(+)
MANSSSKKLIKSNATRLSRLRILLVISPGLFLTYFFFRTPHFTPFHITILCISLLFQWLPYYFLWAAARPRYYDDGHLQYGGEDISQPGVLEYAHDLIYLSSFVQITSILTKWAFLIILVVPVYAVYSTCVAAPSNGSADKTDDQMFQQMHGGASRAGLSRKERRKADRDARKNR